MKNRTVLEAGCTTCSLHFGNGSSIESRQGLVLLDGFEIDPVDNRKMRAYIERGWTVRRILVRDDRLLALSEASVKIGAYLKPKGVPRWWSKQKSSPLAKATRIPVSV